jgi:hypothetical protein
MTFNNHQLQITCGKADRISTDIPKRSIQVDLSTEDLVDRGAVRNVEAIE